MFGELAPKIKSFWAMLPLIAKGDLPVFNGKRIVRQAVGTNNHVLTADSAQASGVKWAAVSSTPTPNTSTVADEFFNAYKDTTPQHLIGNAFRFAYDGSAIAETYDGGGAAYEEIYHPGTLFVAADPGNASSYGRLRHVPANSGDVNMKTLYGSRIGFLMKVKAAAAARYWFGVTNEQTNTTPPTGQGVGFRYDNSSQGDTNWMAYTNGGSGTVTDTGVAPASAFKYFEIEFVSSSSIKFYINGTLVATNTTNIPSDTTDMGLFLLARNSATGAGNQAQILFDYMQWSFSGTRYS